MADGLKISVVTPCFNSIHTIRETIESVRTQDYPSVEHLVMDGGSTDGTLEVLRHYPHLIWASEKDEGHYDAMNKGIDRSTGEVIVILNADDCFRPNVLSRVAEAFQRNPAWDALFGDIVYVDGAGREIYRREEAKFDYDVLRWSGINYVIHQTLFVKNSVYDRLGRYRHKDFKNCCDYEFVLRMGRAGCHVGHLPLLLLNYRYHENGQSADLRIVANMLKECRAIQREYGVPGGLAGKLLRFEARLQRQLQKLFFRGKVDLIPGHWILKKHMRPQTNFSSNIGLDKL